MQTYEVGPTLLPLKFSTVIDIPNMCELHYGDISVDCKPKMLLPHDIYIRLSTSLC